jgi:signal transduction histidine kinase
MTMSAQKGEAEASDRLTDLGLISASVGHHVINAFSAVVSNAELIRARAFDSKIAPDLDELTIAMIETALDASRVARRLIEWARNATSSGTSETGTDAQAVDLNQLIPELIETEKSAEGAAVDWVLDLAPTPSIPGDAGRLRSMLGKLIRNAVEALPRGSGTVAITTQFDVRSFLVMTIRDSGFGMSPEVLKHAIEPFFSTKPDHAGVGLTIAIGIWRRHGGAFSIDSHPGQGTAIRLSIGPFPLPREVEPAVPPREPLEFL